MQQQIPALPIINAQNPPIFIQQHIKRKRKTITFKSCWVPIQCLTILKKDWFGVGNSLSDLVKAHYLKGTWKHGTLQHHNSSVSKPEQFSSIHKILTLVTISFGCHFHTLTLESIKKLSCQYHPVLSNQHRVVV